MRVVLDTNVIVSALISTKSAPAAVLDLWRSAAFDLVISDDILAEIQRVFRYPKVRRVLRYTDDEVTRVLELLRYGALYVEFVPPISEFERDPADTMILAAALAAGANAVVSGDRDLLSLGHYQGIPIMTPAEFLAWLASGH